MSSEVKKTLTPEEERLFFEALGYRLYVMVHRGHHMGHKRPFSAAQDYLYVESLEGFDREASEFLGDCLNFEEVFEKWKRITHWQPGARVSEKAREFF